MRVSITLRNTRKLGRKDWDELIQEVRDAIDDHALPAPRTATIGDGQVCWTAEFEASDAAFAKVALREIVTNPDGSEYAGLEWLGVTDVAEVRT